MELLDTIIKLCVFILIIFLFSFLIYGFVFIIYTKITKY
jgi:hypothetical protein